MTMIDPATLSGSVILGRYMIEGEPRHTGGFAHIYQAVDRRVAGRRVAVKVLRRKYAQDDRWRSQFRTETLALEAVRSANVVVVYDRVEGDPDTGLDFLVMEWIDGDNLETFRLSRPDLPLDELLSLAIGITEGVQRIHQRVAHGDITPRNIMLKDEKIPVIIDFGLSWDILEATDDERQQGGTILYLAPEQFGAVPEQGTAADIYSLGAVLYFLFSGQHYFPQLKEAVETYGQLYGSSVTLYDYGRYLGDLWSKWKYQPLQLAMPPQHRARLNGLLQRMLSRDSGRRPTASAVLEELRQIQQVVSKTPPLTASPLEADRYAVVVADYAEGRLLDTRLPLKAHEYNGGWLFLTDDLYLGRHDGDCCGVLLYDDQIVFSAWFEAESQPFRFYVHPPSVDESASMDIYPGRLKKVDNLTLADCEFEQHLTLHKPLDVALLVDGALAAPDLQQAQAFAAALFEGLTRNDYDVRGAVCVYGEHPDHPGGRAGWNMPFRSELLELDSPDLAREFMAALRPRDFRGKGYAGSLEFGLWELSRLNWRTAAAKHVLVIGSSPPHPSSEERSRFGLVDFTVEEYKYKDAAGVEHPVQHWDPVWQSLHQMRIHTHGLWLKPSDYDVTPNVMGYLESVWSKLNSEVNNRFRAAQSSDIQPILRRIESTIRAVPVAGSPTHFPLLASAAQELLGGIL